MVNIRNPALLPFLLKKIYLLLCSLHFKLILFKLGYNNYINLWIWFIIYVLTIFIGPIGMAAAAAIATAKKRKRPHSFETNPSIRKRQQTRLLR